MAEVPLVDLEVIVRYSLAIRQERAPAKEVLAALEESRALVLSLLGDEVVNGGEDQADEVVEAEAAVAERREHTFADGYQDEVPGMADEEAGFFAPADDDEVADGVAEEAMAAEDAVALDDLAGSAPDVDGTPGLDLGPASRRQPIVRRRERSRVRYEPPPQEVRRRPEPSAVRSWPNPLPPTVRSQPEQQIPAAPEDDPEWMDEVERIRQRRIRKARLEAEERQARQAELARQAEAAKLAREAEESEEAEALRIQQERRAARGTRAEQAPPGDEQPRPERPAAPRPSPEPARRRSLDDALDLPAPLPSAEAARRREERRRRRDQRQG